MHFLLSQRERLLLLGVVVWLVGALLGEGVILAGAGITGAALLLYLERSALTHWRGAATWLAYGALSIASIAWATRPLRSGAPWSALHWGLFPLALLALRRVPNARRAWLLYVFSAMAIINGLVSVVQHYSDWFDQPLFEQVFSVGRVLEPADDGGYKAGGLHFHRLRYAHTLVPLSLVMLPEMWRERRRVLAAIVALTSLVGLWFTYTHASWLALGVGIAFLVAATRSQARWAIAFAACGLTLVPLLAAAGLHYPADRSFAWDTALQLWRAHPLLGVGYGGYTTAALALLDGPNETWPLLHTDAHSLFLQVLSEQGVVGLLLWVGMIVFYLRWLGSGRPTARQCGVMGALGIIAIVHNWAFHPVVLACAAWALAFADQRDE